MNHNPPWKACWIVNHWEVTSDRGDPSDEYDVFEDPDLETARLGAAAPDLLAACEAVVSVAQQMLFRGSYAKIEQEAIDKCSFAIGKARGKP